MPPRPYVQRRAAKAFDRERVLRAVDRIQRQRGFVSSEETYFHLSAFAGRRVEDLQEAAGHDPQEDAQELAFQAMEAVGAGAAALAAQALTLDPGCVDAMGVLALQAPAQTREAGLRAAVAASQPCLEALAAQETLKNLWSTPQARPGLRARAALARYLEAEGRIQEASRLWEALLLLDLPDGQGCRFNLVRCYFALNQLKPLQDLLHTFREDQGGILAWARVLERLRSHSPKRAVQLLAKARVANPHVEGYLTGRVPLPAACPLSLSPGTPEEAQAVMAFLGAAWGGDPEAMRWLFQGGVS